jgi:sugar fermentation stimulation protein A
MAALLPEAEAVMLYFINREDCDRFAPGDDRDPTYGQLLRSAIAQGMRVLPCRFAVSPEGLRFLGLATCDF